MKKTMLGFMILTASVAGVCYGYNNVGGAPNPPAIGNKGPNAMDNSDRSNTTMDNSNSERYPSTNSDQ